MGIKSPYTELFHDFCTHSDPVTTDNLFRGRIPDDKLLVIKIKFVNVGGTVGPFSHFPKCNLPQTTQFTQNDRNHLGRGTKYIVIFYTEKKVLLLYKSYLPFNQCLWLRSNDFFR